MKQTIKGFQSGLDIVSVDLKMIVDDLNSEIGASHIADFVDFLLDLKGSE